MYQVLSQTFAIVLFLAGSMELACTNEPISIPDSGSEDGIDSGKHDGDDSVADEEYDGDDMGIECDVSNDCLEGYRCLDGRCVMGWTATFLPEGWVTTRFPTSGRTLAVNSQGDVYLTGTFHGEVDFDPGPGVENHSSVGGVDGFILKLNSSGEYAQTVIVSGTSGEDELRELSGLSIGPNGDIYIGGVVQQGKIDVDPGPDVIEVQAFAPMQDPPSSGIWAVFIVRLGSDASFKWVHTFAGAVDPWLEYTVDLFGINVTESGKVVATGYYNEIQWEDQSSGSNHINATGLATFARQMIADGSHQWTAGQQTMSDLGFSGPNGLEVGKNGDVFISGYYESNFPIDFDPGPGEDWRGYESGNFVWWLGADGSYLGAI